MRRKERLKRLRALCRFPTLSGFIPNIQLVGQDDPTKVAQSQKPLIDWAEQVASLFTSDQHRHHFVALRSEYQDRATPENKRGTLASNMVDVIRQEIHDLEDAEPHWSVKPAFWLLVTSVVIALIALILAWRADQRTGLAPGSSPTPVATPTAMATSPPSVSPMETTTPDEADQDANSPTQ
jgi:hypothetical protein